MRSKIKILSLIVAILIILTGIIVYAATSTGTIIYYKADGTTEISRQEVSSGQAFTILDNDAATRERWISQEKGLTFATGQVISKWSYGLMPLKLIPYSESAYIEVDDSNVVEDGPYMPTGFTEVAEATSTNGYTIQDNSGNEYVWVEVPKTLYNNASYNTETTEGDKKPASSTDYDNIEYCLHQYTSVYRNGTDYTDTWYSENQHGLTETQYNELKQKMLKSVYENGGFYIGKYEAGTATARTSSGASLTTPVIQQNAYPYNYVTNKQAQTLASSMESGNYTSSLMFGVQWDLVLKYLETKGATQAELNEDSTDWGNYYDNLWNITNTNAKYYTSSTWKNGAYGEKTSSSNILLSTGASDTFNKMGIYDLAGNVFEWTLEYTSNTAYPCAERGGCYYDYGDSIPASYRHYRHTTYSYSYNGWRVTLY